MNDSILTTGNGNIVILATSGDSAANHGVQLNASGSLTSTSAGSEAGTISIDGVSQSSDRVGNGVVVSGDISSVNGSIDITGESALGKGVSLQGTTISSIGVGFDAATITIDGSSSGVDNSFANGIFVTPTTLATSVDGNISLTGSGNTEASAGVEAGILLGGTFTSTGTGSNAANINLTGTNAGGSGRGINAGSFTIDSVDGNINITGNDSENGLRLTSLANIGSASTTGDITLTADVIELSTDVTIQSSGRATVSSIDAGNVDRTWRRCGRHTEPDSE